MLIFSPRPAVFPNPLLLYTSTIAIPPDTGDFTVWLRKSQFESDKALSMQFKLLEQCLLQAKALGSIDATVGVSFGGEAEFVGRCLVAFTCSRQAISITVRLANSKRTPAGNNAGASENSIEGSSELTFPIGNSMIAAKFWDLLENGGKNGSTNAEGTKESSGKHRNATGLVVIAGSTESGKSELTKTLIQERLKRVKADNSKVPHLVTYEDPIENWFPESKTSCDDVIAMNDRGIAFTPRSAQKDVLSIKQGLLDARRQTPACFFVGEVRDNGDWKDILDFAGSGHLIVVTTHAANLQEAILRIFRALKVKTPQQRRSVANSLLAVIHAKLISSHFEYEPILKAATRVVPEEAPDNAKCGVGEKDHSYSKCAVKCKAQLPTIWLGTVSAISQLTADGLSSVTPNGVSCYGRAQFLDSLHLGSFKILDKAKNEPIGEVDSEVNANTCKLIAQNEDIEELANP